MYYPNGTGNPHNRNILGTIRWADIVPNDENARIIVPISRFNIFPLYSVNADGTRNRVVDYKNARSTPMPTIDTTIQTGRSGSGTLTVTIQLLEEERIYTFNVDFQARNSHNLFKGGHTAINQVNNGNFEEVQAETEWSIEVINNIQPAALR